MHFKEIFDLRRKYSLKKEFYGRNAEDPIVIPTTGHDASSIKYFLETKSPFKHYFT